MSRITLHRLNRSNYPRYLRNPRFYSFARNANEKMSSAVMPWRWVFESPSCLRGRLEPGLCDPLPARRRVKRLYTRPGPLIQASYGHLIGSPKICIRSTNMEEDRFILTDATIRDKRRRVGRGAASCSCLCRGCEILNRFAATKCLTKMQCVHRIVEGSGMFPFFPVAGFSFVLRFVRLLAVFCDRGRPSSWRVSLRA